MKPSGRLFVGGNMTDIKTSHFCPRCRRETTHKHMSMRSDTVVVECLGCLTVFAKNLRECGGLSRCQARSG